jgi:hypothetical protein
MHAHVISYKMVLYPYNLFGLSTKLSLILSSRVFIFKIGYHNVYVYILIPTIPRPMYSQHTF